MSTPTGGAADMFEDTVAPKLLTSLMIIPKAMFRCLRQETSVETHISPILPSHCQSLFILLTLYEFPNRETSERGQYEIAVLHKAMALSKSYPTYI
jgi:hypothetical protein